MLLFFGGFRAEKTLKDQPGKEPDRCVIEADDAADIPGRAAVIPGAHLSFLQEAAGAVFCREDADGIDDPPQDDVHPFYEAADRFEEDRQPIDWEHQHGGVSHPLFLTASERLQRGKEDFHTPARDAASDKAAEKFLNLFCERDTFFHNNKVFPGKEGLYI